MRSEDNPGGRACRNNEAYLSRVSPLAGKCLRAPVYIRKRNADRKTTAGSFFTRRKRKQTD